MVTRCLGIHRVLLSKAIPHLSKFPYIVIAVGFLIGSMSCKKEEATELPPKDVLIDLMTELYIAETPMARVPKELRDSVGLEIRKRIARSFGMEPDEMEKIISAVQTDVDLNIEISDSVLVRLEERENELKQKN